MGRKSLVVQNVIGCAIKFLLALSIMLIVRGATKVILLITSKACTMRGGLNVLTN